MMQGLGGKYGFLGYMVINGLNFYELKKQNTVSLQKKSKVDIGLFSVFFVTDIVGCEEL